ncbi:hypothetical protein Pst134EA_019560 [Puccinia striiformis f. sp. tritici]|uniref:hypothetical protein n=1 Tax=Puccinia striiformis f. sp. tritici TaxID=168172 RepID=UPI002008AACB|nr:hypothetical protein Pst134EA_019560 [Puccinia striiformis f. sp. tritici]KAH9459407.1 hypothetical protein Pst134EA_019560 [Puccinia striiformis f. sp. tritici]
MAQKHKIAGVTAKEAYKKIPSKAGKNNITWDTNDNSLAAFKHAVIAGIQRDNVGVFADHVALYDEMKQQEDPKSVARVAAVIAGLEKSQAKKSKYILADDIKPKEDWAPSAGALSQANVMKIAATLGETHPPRPRLTGKHECGALVNPKNDSEYVLLTTERMILWAQAMTVNPEVTAYIPPVSPAFDWQTRLPAEAPATNLSPKPNPIPPAVPGSAMGQQLPNGLTPWNGPPTPIQQAPAAPIYPHLPQPMGYPAPFMFNSFPPHYYGHPPPQMGGQFTYHPSQVFPGQPSGNPYTLPHPPMYHAGDVSAQLAQGSSTSQAVVNPNQSLPSVLEEAIDLGQYLKFTHVNPSLDQVREALNQLSITHYTSFQDFTATELEDAGFKKAHARALTASIGRLERHLKKTRANNNNA